MEIQMSDAATDLSTLFSQIAKESDPDNKTRLLVDFMESLLSNDKTPQFKEFWEARKKALDLFKEVKNPVVRNQLWERFSELSKEARRLKDILDEQSAFHSEQIDLAIKAIEEECSNLENEISLQPELDLSEYSKFLQSDLSYFEPKQRALNLLNAYASRVNALRKDLIKLEMRIRQKNKFFQRLSKVGDLIFPQRKELIKDISDRFKERVQTFKQKYFANGVVESPHFLRDEIKGLQGAAKFFTLSAQTFKESRLLLSECWDMLKAEEKEFKKHLQEKREVFKANEAELLKTLEEIKSRFEANELSTHNAETALKDFSNEMRDKELGREEVQVLRSKASEFKSLIDNRSEQEAKERLKEAEKKEAEKQAELSQFLEKIEQLVNESEKLEIKAIEAKRDQLLEEIASLSYPKRDKAPLEKAFRPLADILVEKKEALLLDLPEDDQKALKQLKELLQERRDRKKAQKELVDKLKKEAGGSGLDMVKALELSQQLAEEKEKLDCLTAGVQELESKIATF